MSALLSPRLAAIALDPVTQIVLAKIHHVRWSSPSEQAAPAKRKMNDYGRVRRVAQAWLRGDYGTKPYQEVAILEKVSTDSLKQTIWKERTGYKSPPRKPRNRRKAA